jgi:hypothetical protein
MPETTATFLAKHELSSYTAAFDEHGWDSLPALQDISDDDLKQLVTDVAMKSGHAARLRTALGKAPAAAAAAPAENGPAVPAVLAAPAVAGQLDQGPPYQLVPTSADATALQKQLQDKLMQGDMLGGLQHGSTIQTYQAPNGGEVMIRLVDKQLHYCICCPITVSDHHHQTCHSLMSCRLLYKLVEGYTADYTAKNRCIALYTDTRCVTALHSYTATIQLYIIQLYSAIHYTQPLQSPSGRPIRLENLHGISQRAVRSVIP